MSVGVAVGVFVGVFGGPHDAGDVPLVLIELPAMAGHDVDGTSPHEQTLLTASYAIIEPHTTLAQVELQEPELAMLLYAH